MLTEEYVSFEHISIDHEAALFEADLHESNLYESNLYESNLYESNLYESNPHEPNPHEPDEFCESICESNDVPFPHDVAESISVADDQRSVRSKGEAADATARLASHLRQLSRGLGIGRSGQIQTVQQPSPVPAEATVDNIVSAPSVILSEDRVFGSLHPDYIVSGCPGLDRLLPGGGYEPGCLVEWFYSGAGGAAGSLAMLSAIAAMREGKALVVIDWEHTFYPSAAIALGVDLKRLIVIRPTSREDGWWSLDQALRCSAVGSVWSNLPDEMDDRLARRLQLAAEMGGTLGMLLRHNRTRNRPSWADVQWQVRPASHLDFSKTSSALQSPSTEPHSGRYVQVDLVRCRSGAGYGGYKRQSIWLELGHPSRQLLAQSIFSSPHPSSPAIVKTTWIREIPAPQTAQKSQAAQKSQPQSKYPASDSGPMRNDSYGDMPTSSYTQRMAAQLAMPTRTNSAAAAVNATPPDRFQHDHSQHDHSQQCIAKPTSPNSACAVSA